MGLNIFTDFCNWWWLAWLLPFILGLLLGYTIWAKWARKTRILEDDLARVKNDFRKKEKEFKDCNNERTRLEGEFKNVKRRNQDLKSKLDLVTTSTSSGFEKATSVIGASQAIPKMSEQKLDGFASLKTNNFQLIEGIGPKMESVLHENGINSWTELSTKSKGELKAILDQYGDKYAIIDPSDWPLQAKFAMKNNWKKLMTFQKSEGSISKAEKFFKTKGWI